MADYVTWLRERVGSMKVFMAYVTALVTDDAGRILCQRRSDFDCWGLPGGAVEVGETLEACLRREVAEETGISAEIQELLGVYSSPDYAFTYPNGDHVQQFTICYTCAPSGGCSTVRGHESTDARFFPPDELPPIFPWYRVMVDDFLSGERRVFARGSAGAPLSDEPGFHRLRRHVGHETLIVPAAAAVIRDDRGRVLLHRRCDTGAWALPGGALELGERVDTGLIRETQEEVGLLVEPVFLIGVRAGPELFFRLPNQDCIQAVTAFFRCRVLSGTPRPDGVEADAVRFFSAAELPAEPPWMAILKAFLEEGASD